MNQSTAYVLALLVGVGLGLLGRTLLRSRVRLAWSEAVLAGVVGSAAGVVVTAGRHVETWVASVVAILVAFVTTLILLLVVERVKSRRQLPRGSAEQLIRIGESSRVEFKSSARFNRHTGQRDEKIEQVIAKTVAGFLNAEGGALLIGVTDDGDVCGLADDYALMKVPDSDRFELWLRDMLVLALGVSEAARIDIAFERLRDLDVSIVRVPPARRPVFVRPTKGDAPPVFVVRMGNSTRELPVDQTLAYCVDRWGRGALKSASV